jgi:hypothetical protein
MPQASNIFRGSDVQSQSFRFFFSFSLSMN